MTYLFLYVVGIVLIWWIYCVGWVEALKTVIKVLVPSILIILFNIKALEKIKLSLVKSH